MVRYRRLTSQRETTLYSLLYDYVRTPTQHTCHRQSSISHHNILYSNAQHLDRHTRTVCVRFATHTPHTKSLVVCDTTSQRTSDASWLLRSRLPAPLPTGLRARRTPIARQDCREGIRPQSIRRVVERLCMHKGQGTAYLPCMHIPYRRCKAIQRVCAAAMRLGSTWQMDHTLSAHTLAGRHSDNKLPRAHTCNRAPIPAAAYPSRW